MYNVELPNTINQIIVVFYELGLWDTQQKTVFCTTAVKMIHVAYYISCVTSIAVKALITNDPDDSVFLTALAVLATVHIFRMVYIILKKSETIELVHEIGTHSTNSIEEFIQVDNKIKKFMKFAKAFILACFCEVSMIIIFPAISNEQAIINVAFPLRNSRMTFWVKQVFVLIGALYSVVCVFLSIIIWFLLLNGAIKYEMLGSKFRNLGDTKTKDTSTDFTTKKVIISKTRQQQEFLKDLKEAIKTHRKINM